MLEPKVVRGVRAIQSRSVWFRFFQRTKFGQDVTYAIRFTFL